MKYHERRKAKVCLRSTVFENHRKSPIKEKVSYVYKGSLNMAKMGPFFENMKHCRDLTSIGQNLLGHFICERNNCLLATF